MNLLAIEFPPISHVIEWPGIFLKDTVFEVNKVVLLMWLTVLIVFAFFFIAGRKQSLVPTGVARLSESWASPASASPGSSARSSKLSGYPAGSS